MANMTFKANILPATTAHEYNLGSSTQQWNVYGPIHSNGIYGTPNVDYGDTLPATAVNGQIFFKTSDTVVYSVPAGGTAGYALIKNTNTSGDFSWQEIVGGVSGVKGNAENSYRTGNVNLTPANIGAATSDHNHDSIYLKLTGGTMSGAIYTHGLVGTENIDYGSTLPTTASEGQIFFQTTTTVVYSVPPGGTAGYALVKNTNTSGDFSWQEVAHESYSILAATENGTSATLVTTGDKYRWNNAGGVMSVQVGATSPVLSSNATTATVNFATTISLADAYGDAKNPYAAKSAKYVLAGPVSVLGTRTRTNNLLNIDDASETYAYIAANGAVNNSAADRLGPFISVTPGQDIYYTGTVGQTDSASINRRLHVYDVNQDWIAQVSYASNLQVGNNWSTHGTITSNGAYVRVSWGENDTNLMISVGSPTQYEPYYAVVSTETADAAPTFRALTRTDIPILDIDASTTGTLPVSRGGTGASTPAEAWINLGGGTIGKLDKGTSTATFLANNGTWRTPPGTYTLPKATTAILGGITVGSGLSVDDGNLSVNWNNAPVQSVNGSTGAVVLSDLIIGNSRYNGSTTTTIALTDLGLTSPMTFRGVTDTVLVDGVNTTPITIISGGTIGSLTPGSGDVVLQQAEQIEYLYSVTPGGTACWVQLGIASSYSLAEHAHGYILNDGIMATTAAVATGDHLIIADASDYNRIISGDSLTFDTSSPQSALSRAGTWVDYLQLTGGTMTGAVKTKGIIGTVDYDYGEILPVTATEGQLFFQVSYGTDYDLPPGGTAGCALIKNSNNDGDVTWGTVQSLPNGGGVGDVLTKNSNNDGDVIWASAATASYATTAGYATTATNYVLKAGDTMTGNLTLPSGGRLGKTSGNLYIGASDNSGWVLTQDICSHSGAGDTYWSVRIAGTAHFKTAYGAVWNDYAEMRNVPKAQIDIHRIYDDKGEVDRNYPYAGYCVYEIGNGEMEITDQRLMKGCKIISDTFGFCIGETENCCTPIAVTGRVLAYPYEDIEEFKEHIGDCVCSGPNGTISLMTQEEKIKHPECIVGTISEIPSYDVWHCGNKLTKPINVDGRIWIYVK